MGYLSPVTVLALSLLRTLWGWFLVVVVAIGELALVAIAFIVAASIVLWVSDRLVDSASKQIVQKRATLVPTLLTFIGAVSIPAAKDVVSEWSTAAAWAFSVILALLTFIGASLAAGAESQARAVRWSGYAILVIPLFVIAAGAVIFWHSWWTAFRGLELRDKALLIGGASLYVVAIVTGVVLIRNKALSAVSG